jgi:cobalamin biosynthesis protein CobT
MKYICLIVLAPDFMTTICKKAAQHFHSAVSRVFDRVKSVALSSTNFRKLAKDHKGYCSGAKYVRAVLVKVLIDPSKY